MSHRSGYADDLQFAAGSEPAAATRRASPQPGAGSTATSPPPDPALPGAPARDPALLRAWADAALDPLPAASPLRTAAWSTDLGYATPRLDDEVVAIAHARARQLPVALHTTTSPQLRDPQVAWSTARNPGASAAELAAAEGSTRWNRAELADLFAEVDLLLTPTTPGRPHGHRGPGEHLGVALTWAFNLIGHPAASIPAEFTRDGAPVGLQLIARPHADTALPEFLARHCPPARTARIRSTLLRRSGRSGLVQAFHFVRQSDGLVYRFEREAADVNGRPSYRRTDGVATCRWLEGEGWCVVDNEGRPNGWPVDSPSDSDTPPARSWRSAKACRSHLYELHPLQDGE
ncbi:amidase family protein [Pseudonocardia sp. WMMC193]|uniref:amidase family protein n=1 Tax=Pseudonocardia sp. WMMC193 TaxID=2911965 RepID=UPI001EEE1FD3|nr:amidase family protein [Pseudonocardia sp. WMMC193]MCF7548578.1 hypothetical protein [Pseudonocardia sp. WMMC193]